MEINKVYNMPCEVGLQTVPDNFIDCTVTSPPYDNLRTYGTDKEIFNFEIFKKIAKELYRITKVGGVVVWVVGDATINGSETGTSFKQALYFKECGFNLHDTMIYHKINSLPQNFNRYEQCFEYMFVFTKGILKTFNAILEKTKGFGTVKDWNGKKNVKGSLMRVQNKITITKEYKTKNNIFSYNIGNSNSDDKNEHPAPFPEQLVADQINSWSNEGDLILDCFMGSGTTAKVAIKLNRNFLGFEINKDYCDIIEKRIINSKDLFTNL